MSKHTFKLCVSAPGDDHLDVAVRGECFYRPNVNFPHRIEVTSMEELSTCEELPTLRDLQGIAPNLTGELSSEEFVRRQRDEWD